MFCFYYCGQFFKLALKELNCLDFLIWSVRKTRNREKGHKRYEKLDNYINKNRIKTAKN